MPEGGELDIRNDVLVPTEDALNTPGPSEGLPDARGRPLRAVKRGKCTYTKKGVCTNHGEGAIRKWKPTRTVVVDADGVETVVKGREYFWKCDLDANMRKVKQTTLSFLKTTPGINTTMNDTEQRGGRFGDFERRFSGAADSLCARDMMSSRERT